MKNFTAFAFIATLLLHAVGGYSQSPGNGGWIFLSHTQKLSKKFDLLADAQLRSANKYAYVSTLLLRGAISYKLNEANAVAVGYAYLDNWDRQGAKRSYSLENRLFEQYQYGFKIKKIAMKLRARLEQRFVKKETVAFSQRARAFVSAQIPLVAGAQFNKGFYVEVQDEIFFNIQHKNVVNNSLFDQNRPYGALGYRWSKKFDTEVGYMYWVKRNFDADSRRNILQLKITTAL